MQKSTGAAPVMELATATLADKTEGKKARATEDEPEAVRPQQFGPTVASNYSFITATNASLADMSSGTTQLLGSNIDDTASPLTAIGFDFFFQGARFTQFSINENGVLRLGATAQTATPYKPLGQAGIPIITAYGADQRTHAGDGQVHFKLFGAAPTRVLVVEWLNNQSNFNAGGTADLTYQVRLYETTGVIEFVYGTMTMSTAGAADVNSHDPNIGFSSNNTAGTIGSVAAPQSGTPAPSFDGSAATATANLYSAGPITTLSSISQGSRRIFSFTPPTATAPTNLNFTGVTQLGMTLNWTDSPNETLYAIYRSTDGVNYTFDGTAPQNATSFVATGLDPSVTYFWRVFAVSEGALSSALSGSQATLAPGSISSTAAGGNWSSTATWAGGVVPGVGDNATIVSGATVTIDTAATCLNLTVQSGAILQFEATTARTLTASQSVTVNLGGTFQSASTGTQTGHVVSINRDLTNNGAIDFSTNGNTAGASITFTGPTSASMTLGGSSATDVQQTSGVTLNKGANSTLSFTPGGTFTVLGANSVGFLTITNGTFKLDGTNAFSNPVFSVVAYSIPATGGFWMNNPNAIVLGQNGSATLSGSFRMSQGTYNIGVATGNSLGFASGSNINVEGGSITSAGRFGVTASGNAITYNQSAGTITVCTVGNTSTTLASFDLGTGVGTTNITGGTIIVQLANTAVSGPRDFRNQSGLTGIVNVTGGTLQLGNAVSGAAKAFSIAGVIPNLVIDNTSANHSATFLAPAVFNNITRNITINSGTTLNIGNNVFLMNGSTLTNNGTFTANGASSNFVWFLTTAPVLYTGTGSVTAPVTNMAFQADQGVTFDPASNNIVVGAIRLFSGSVINSNKLTLGNGGATTGVVQIGNTTTPTAAGSFDAPFSFNLGTGGQTVSYLRTTAARSTGPEINPSRQLTSLTYDDNDASHALTVAGGDLTLASTGTALTMTNGRIVTGVNNLILSSGSATVTRTNGYVDGNLRKTFAASAAKTFEVGTANGFSPAIINVTAGTPGNVTVKAVQGKQPNVPGTNALQRYWQLTASGLTADLTFQYLAGDVVGTESNYQVAKYTGTFLSPAGSSINTGTHQALAPAQTTFTADWTAAEPGSLVGSPGTLQFSSASYSAMEDSPGNATITVTRTGGSFGPASIQYATASGTAIGGASCAPFGTDYINATGTLNWADGDSVAKTFTVSFCNETLFENDETLGLTLSNPTGSTLGAPASATLTILNDDAPPPPRNPGDLLVSEFRFHGATGANSATDEFIELYNTTGGSFIVGSNDGSTGFAIAASDGITRCFIPNGTVIPARGHFLCANSTGYSLGFYATPNATYTTDIPDADGIAVFQTSNPANFGPATRLDSVGFNAVANPLYREGAGLSLVNGDGQYSLVRKSVQGAPQQDTENNAADFVLVSPDAGTFGSTVAERGAPGPQGLITPIQSNATIAASLIDLSQPATAPPNRIRDNTPGSGATALGTLDIRRKFTNNTGAVVNSIRIRAVDITTTNTPSVFPLADVRLLTSGDTTANGGTITIVGTTLESPSDPVNGGGMNSTVTVALPGTGLAPGASINIRLLLGVVSGGVYRFYLDVEATGPNISTVPFKAPRGKAGTMRANQK